MKLSYQDLEKELEAVRQERDRLASLVDETHHTKLCSSLNETLRKIYDICKSMVDATCGYVALKNEDGSLNEVLFLDDGGLPCSVDPNLPMPIRGLRADAYEKGEAVYDNDFMNSEWIKFMPPGHVELKNVMFAPLNISGEVAGIIGLANKPKDFTDQDKNIAKAFGDVAALIMEKEQIYEALRKSEQRFHLAMEATSEGVFDNDILTGKSYYSPAWKMMLGYSPIEISDDAFEWKRFLHPDDLEKTNSIIINTLNEKRKTFKAEFRMRHKSGKWIDILAKAKILYDSDGNATRVIGTHKDITANKKAHCTIKQNQAFLRKAQEIGRIGTWELNIANNRLLWTDESYNIFGVPIGTELNYEVFLIVSIRKIENWLMMNGMLP